MFEVSHHKPGVLRNRNQISRFGLDIGSAQLDVFGGFRFDAGACARVPKPARGSRASRQALPRFLPPTSKPFFCFLHAGSAGTPAWSSPHARRGRPCPFKHDGDQEAGLGAPANPGLRAPIVADIGGPDMEAVAVTPFQCRRRCGTRVFFFSAPRFEPSLSHSRCAPTMRLSCII